MRLCKKVNKLADLYFFGKLFHPLVQARLTFDLMHYITVYIILRYIMPCGVAWHGVTPGAAARPST